MGCIAARGSVTSSKMAAKMAAILDFTNNSNLPGKCENCKYFFPELYNVIELNILLLLQHFMFFFSLKNGGQAFLFKNGLTSCYL